MATANWKALWPTWATKEDIYSSQPAKDGAVKPDTWNACDLTDADCTTGKVNPLACLCTQRPEGECNLTCTPD